MDVAVVRGRLEGRADAAQGAGSLVALVPHVGGGGVGGGARRRLERRVERFETGGQRVVEDHLLARLGGLDEQVDEDEIAGEARTVLHVHPRLAPYQVAVLPLSKKETLEGLSRQVLGSLQPHFMCDFDVTQSIGRRYRRQDEIGTPWCVTVDFDSLEDGSVTVRDRDSTEQVRLPVDQVSGEIRRRLDAAGTPAAG